MYGLVCVDDRGRIADRAVVRALGWAPGCALAVCESAGVIMVRRDRRGLLRVDARGYLRLPPAVRRWCGITAGEQVLLGAEPGRSVLVVYPLGVLDAMLNGALSASGESAAGGEWS